jgi:hypothetical protein
MSKVTETKRAYAQKIYAQQAALGVHNPVIVLPVVEEDGDEVFIDHNNAVTKSKKEGSLFGSIQLYQVTTTFNEKKRIQNDSERFTLLSGKAASLAAMYKPGQVLSGRIVSEDSIVPTDPTDPSRDLKYLNTDAQAANMPLVAEGGKPIYNIKYWTMDSNKQDVRIEASNRLAVEAALRANNNANSSAIKNAAATITSKPTA